MMYDDTYHDAYDHYEDAFDPMRSDRKARRRRKPKAKHNPKKDERAIIEELADDGAVEINFEITYQPSVYESGWLVESLKSFYEQGLITDVLAQVKGGKEATVYRCRANPQTGHELLAVKVYRPRMFRNLRNDKVYREGREIMQIEGGSVKENEQRTMRALEKRSTFGNQLAHTSWLMHEYSTLQRLHQVGADVPQALAVSDNAVLMAYFGDEQLAAPTLSEVELEPDEAPALFAAVLRNLELMLRHNLVHGDLSAYNILYWDGAVTLIDFPQVIDPGVNSQTQMILARDVERVCDYFSEQGVRCDAEQITRKLWAQFLAPDPEAQAADLSRFEAAADSADE
ncbi:MAG: hypothetical protein GYB67_10945 [Chloroflexi bacterium]|nr:hypothetical protein [Chloroflexota bacterium]